MNEQPELPAPSLTNEILKDFPFIHYEKKLTGNRTLSQIKGPGVCYRIDSESAQEELAKLRKAYLLGRTHPATPDVLDRIIRTLYFAESVVHPKYRTRVTSAITELQQLIDHR